MNIEYGAAGVDAVTRMMHRNARPQHDHTSRGRSGEQRKPQQDLGVDAIKSWLSSSCAYRDLYEHKAGHRHPGTCSWFLSSPQYCDWKNAAVEAPAHNLVDGSLEDNWYDRVLFVQGDPGYGKSVIAGAVIDDLRRQDDGIGDGHGPDQPTTAFFHFNATHSYCIHPHDAFRIIAYELVHAHRQDESVLGAISLLVKETAPSASASSDHVLVILGLLLRRRPTFLVFDGLDECNDVRLFLHVLANLCRKTNTCIIIFSRRHLQIPFEYQKWASDSPHIITLRDDQNSDDIELYLSHGLNQMAKQGFFGINADRTLFSQATKSARGNFLWASTFLRYLGSPLLSADERRTTLCSLPRLENLMSLYGLILGLLERHHMQKQQWLVSMFRWLSCSVNRLSISATQTAVGISPGERTTDSKMLPISTYAVPRLTCGLVEVTRCSVVFAHRSVKEILHAPEFHRSPFSLFDEAACHAALAAQCISYLAYDVPTRTSEASQRRSVSADMPDLRFSSSNPGVGTPADGGHMSSCCEDGRICAPAITAQGLPPLPERLPQAFDSDTPFLRYATLCWPIHLTRALATASSSSPSTYQAASSGPFLSPLSAFLSNRETLTTWIYASYAYNLPPTLTRLIVPLSALRTHTPPATAAGREIRWIVQALREFSNALNTLKREHGESLRKDPGAIWASRGVGAAWRRMNRRSAVEAVGRAPVSRGGMWPVLEVDDAWVADKGTRGPKRGWKVAL